MIKEGKFPEIKESDMRLYKEKFKFTPKGKMDFTKAKIEKVVTKPIKEVSMKLRNPTFNGKIKEVDVSIKKAAYPGKIKVVDNIFKGSLDY